MDQESITDDFYNHFPSLNIDKKSQETRKSFEHYLESKNYLKTATDNQKTDQIYFNSTQKEPTSFIQHFHRELHDNLKHTNLPNSIHPYTIDDRNNNLAQEAIRKKIEYHEALIKQIHDKKDAEKKLRTKEKEEEEKFNRKLEQQLEKMHLDDRLRTKQHRMHHTQLTNDQNFDIDMHLLSKIENNHKKINSCTERKSQSENGKDNSLTKKEPMEKIYKYFTNSAPYLDNNKKIYEILHDKNSQTLNNIKPIDSSSYIATYNIEDLVCDICELQTNKCLNCDRITNYQQKRQPPICENCQQNSFYKNNIQICLNCVSVLCRRCHKWQKQNYEQVVIHKQITNNQIKGAKKNHLIEEKNAIAVSSLSDDMKYDIEISDMDAHIKPPLFVHRSDKKPYSINVEKNSIFHPDVKIEEPKLTLNIKHGRICVSDLDKKLEKYAINYSQLRNRKSNTEFKIDMNFSLLNERDIIHNKTEGKRDSLAINILTDKCKIAAVPEKLITNALSQERVLTQLGAFRKHLKLKQINQYF